MAEYLSFSTSLLYLYTSGLFEVRLTLHENQIASMKAKL